ncbi:M1 family metallopeptidase [Desulfosarcina sp.]|nr:M1 family metallopeptidase [Desulfosarcina sp.]
MKLISTMFFLMVLTSTLFSQQYFQQEVNYTIKVKLNDENHTLMAFEEIEYLNNSPDDLEFIYFHIWPNAYKNNQTALGKQKLEQGGKRKYLNLPEQQGWINSLDFKVNGESIRWEYDEEYIDICKLYLAKPLKSKEKISITTPFFVKLPKGNVSRLGHIEESYQITQWYPKPAVYDARGWHQMPYLNMGEFYSEYGSFDVSITVPENYFVAATGNLQNQDEKKRILDVAEKTALIDTFDKENKTHPPSSKVLKTLRFTENNIHDFAWFADKRFHILKGEVTLPHSGRKVNTWAYFPNHEADLWTNAIEYINDAVYYYSLWYGDYPYDNCTAVNAPIAAGGGMEYPTITVISNSGRAMSLEMVIMHEVGHNWFYGILGTNERDYGWMDEGINTFSEMRYFNKKYPDNRLYKMLFEKESPAALLGIEDYPYNALHYYDYLLGARRNTDQPIMLHSNDYSSMNYGGIIYSKAGLVMYYLHDYLGEEKFNTIMQDYFETWKFKHPYPEDLQKIIEQHVDEDMSWFFKDLMETTKKLDYKILRKKGNQVLVKNSGKIAGPVAVHEISSGKTDTVEWHNGFEGKKWLKLNGEPETIQLNEIYQLPELNQKNNTLKTSGLCRRTEPLEVRLLGLLEKTDRTTINILPAVAWNYYNGFMLGGLLYNDVLPLPHFEYQLMPLYSFGSKDLAGSGKLAYHILPYSNVFQRITLHLSGRQFSYENAGGKYYQKISTGISFRFAQKHLNKAVNNDLQFRYVYASNLETILGYGTEEFKQFYDLKYIHSNNRKIDPYNVAINLQGSDNFLKGSIEANYRHHYIYKNTLDIRFFGGAFLSKSDDLASIYNFNSSGYSGTSDYTYDELFLARFEDPASKLAISNQFVRKDAGLATYSPFGKTNEWILALNVATSLPVAKDIPIQFYANVATFGKSVTIPGWEDAESYLLEGGIKIQVLREIFEFYLPVYMSSDLKSYSDYTTDTWWQNIRFTLYLNKLNPFDMARDI